MLWNGRVHVIPRLYVRNEKIQLRSKPSWIVQTAGGDTDNAGVSFIRLCAAIAAVAFEHHDGFSRTFVANCSTHASAGPIGRPPAGRARRIPGKARLLRNPFNGVWSHRPVGTC
jgi:hypothetical protein